MIRLRKGGICDENEQAFMNRFYKVKRFLFDPLLRLLTFLKIRANHISILESLLCLSLVFYNPPYYIALILALHILLDGLDGPLARFQGKLTIKGAYTDVICDQFCLAFVFYAFIQNDIVSFVAGYFFVFLYTIIVFLCLTRNFLEIRKLYLMHPRLVIFFMFLIDYLFSVGVERIYYDVVLIVCMVFMFPQIVYGSHKLIDVIQAKLKTTKYD